MSTGMRTLAYYLKKKDAEGASTCPAKSPPRTVTVGKKKQKQKNIFKKYVNF